MIFPVVYVEGDLHNLGGLNKEFGNSGADKHFKAMADIAREEFDRLGVEIGYTTKGGDEFGFTVVNATREQVDSVIEKIKSRMVQYCEEQGLDKIPHTKRGKKGGSGINFTARQFDPDEHKDVDEWIKDADRALEKDKEKGGFKREYGEQAETSGGLASSGRPGSSSGGTGSPRVGDEGKGGSQAQRTSGQREEPTGEGVEEEVEEEASKGTTSVIEGISTIELPVAELSLSEDVPNFKEGASLTTGVVEPLSGKYERIGTAPIVVWERSDGRREVVTGRHRLDLARRSGEKTIPAQVVREAEGWTRGRVFTLDAEANIRDNQGKVKDYVNYFQNTKTTEEEASGRGLLARDKGRKGFFIGRYAAPNVLSAYQDGKIPAGKAAVIARNRAWG